MKTNKAGIELIKEFEGLKLKAYICPAGVPTIGYGHTKTVTMEDVRNGKTITPKLAEELLKADLRDFEEPVLNACKLKPNENQFSAMVALAFNIGIAGFRKSSVLRNHNAGDEDSAARSFALWNKATVNGKKVELRGLTRRRAAEASLYLKPIKVEATELQVESGVIEAPVEELMPQAVEPEKPMTESTIIRGASVAGIASSVAIAVEVSKGISEIQSNLGDLFMPAVLLASVGFSIYVILERLKQRRKGWA